MSTEQPERLTGFADAVERLGREARRELGPKDVRTFKRIKWASRAGEWGGRGLLMLARDPVSWFTGFSLLSFHFAMEAHLMHSATHGAYAGLEGGENPREYETLAIPMRAATWRLAHKIHHVHPSSLEDDPDTMHWNPLLGGVFVFETWALDYDRFLKDRGLRAKDDHGELKKLAKFVAYNYLLFPVLSGPNFIPVVLGTWAASTLRNYIFVALQTGSSVGDDVSTRHPLADTKALSRAAARARTEGEGAVRRARCPLRRVPVALGEPQR